MAQLSDTPPHLFGDGTSQQQRRLDALDPAFVKIDEREVEDFLVFALRLADRIKYYDLTNNDRTGAGKPYNWQTFFTRSTSVIIAKIRTTNPLPQKRAVSTALSGSNTLPVLQDIFDGLIGFGRTIDQWEREVDVMSGFKGHIGRLIEANLSNTLGRLVSYERAAAEQFEDYEAFELDRYENFGPKWNLTDPEAVSADPGLFGGYESVEDQIGSAKERLEDLFLALYNAFIGIIRAAPGYFDASVDGRSNHAPHIALFLTFLKLYLQVRDDANRLTERHLDFYYEKVLGLERKEADPDCVHLVFAPAPAVFQARGIKEYKVSEGTAIDAGKDAAGVDRIYTLDDDLVVNLAQIESFKTVFVDYVPQEDPDEKRTVLGIHAAPTANSGDGVGGEFEDEDKPSWPAFGSREMLPATIGFALASRAFLLREGTREITVDLQCVHVPPELDNTAGSPLEEAFDLALSGEEGWIERSRITPTVKDRSTEFVSGREVRRATLEINVTLDPTEEPVTFFDPEVLGHDYGTTLPLLRVTLRPPGSARENTHAYDALKPLVLEDITVMIRVDGITDLIVQNDQFVMDASKPFQPFGPTPEIGSHFYIGNAEAFEKNLARLSFDLEWEGLPGSFAAYYEGYYTPGDAPGTEDFTAEIGLRQDKDWIPIRPPDSSAGTSGESLFIEEDDTVSPRRTIELDAADLGDQEPRKIGALEPWHAGTQNGFVRLTLTPRDFYHDRYASVLTRQTLAAGRLPNEMQAAHYKTSAGAIVVGDSDTGPAPGSVIIPREPYTPTIKSFSLTYEASLNTGAEPELFEFIHLYPFEGRYERRQPENEGYLLPQFDFEGALYLGVDNIKPRQSLSILFQVAEGTADPELTKAEVKWHYLSANEWQAFEDYEITGDTTNALTTSGLISFTVPGSVDTENTVLPPGLWWIRGSVAANAGAVSELISVHPQAVRATFSDQGNDPDHLKTPLPAKTVAGLLEEDAAVAGLDQPYPSFGGRPAEKSTSFYTRISERLRHKGRAVTHFDYERLVLEEYPEIYKVKCIRHTTEKHQQAPGHVLVAVIPDFTDLKAANRRAPKVTLATLDEIKMFLEGINSPFVRTGTEGTDWLHVLNPVYEEVRVSLAVKFRPSVTAVSYHIEELKKAIVRFLSPWAYKRGGEISFGGKVHKSTILNFVEEQPCVDYLTDFQMMHGESDQDVEVIEVTTPRSILVPAVPADHLVTPITTPYCVMEHALDPEGIGAMTVSEDFLIIRPDNSG
jgi:hypothetical protein